MDHIIGTLFPSNQPGTRKITLNCPNINFEKDFSDQGAAKNIFNSKQLRCIQISSRGAEMCMTLVLLWEAYPLLLE